MDDFTPDDRHLANAAAASARLRQGSVIHFRFSAWLADLTRPLTKEAGDQAAQLKVEGEDPEAGEPDGILRDDWLWAMVITQTCDLVRTAAGKVRVQVCPVYEAPGAIELDKSSGERPQYVHVTWHEQEPRAGHRWIADLSAVTTVERSLLPTVGDSGSPREGAERRRAAELIARYYGRAALPNSVSKGLEGLTKKIRDRYDDQSRPHAVIFGSVEQIRVRPKPDYDDAAPWDLTLYFVVDGKDGQFEQREYPTAAAKPTGQPLSDLAAALRESHTNASGPVSAESWVAAVSELLAGVKVGGDIASVRGVLVNSLTADEWESSDKLDLAYLSDSDPDDPDQDDPDPT